MTRFFDQPTMTRRKLMKASAGVAGAAALASIAPSVYAQETPTLKVGLIGAGARGTGAAINIVKSAPGIEITALADLFGENLNRSRQTIQTQVPEAYKVTDETAFVGIDAYQKLIATDVDIVMCASYPHFRPKHAEAAINAGKHFFGEKPIAVDPVGVRMVMKVGELAKEKGLGFLAGTQRRHAPHYQQAVQMVHDGAIGKITGGSLFFCRATGRTPQPRLEGENEMQWMLRNWWYQNWLSGGMLGQLVIHQIDTMHWIMGGPCKSVYGVGGRAVYREPIYGNIFDHTTAMYEYPGGEQFHAYTRMPCAKVRMSGTFLGGEGRLDNASSRAVITKWGRNEPPTIIRSQGNAFEQEHTAFVNSIRAGEPLNEAQNVAESTLMAIMAQVSAWTADELTYDDVLNSPIDLTPPSYTDGTMPPAPVPGAKNFKDFCAGFIKAPATS